MDKKIISLRTIEIDVDIIFSLTIYNDHSVLLERNDFAQEFPSKAAVGFWLSKQFPSLYD